MQITTHKKRIAWNKGLQMSDAFKAKVASRTMEAMNRPGMREKISHATQQAMNRPGMKEKISSRTKEAMKNIDISGRLREYYKTHAGSRKGARHTENAKIKMSINSAGKRTGSSNHNWKGGLTRLQKLEKLAGRKKSEYCEICKNTAKTQFEHDHKTGEFRGWVCFPCNAMLGLAKDNPDTLLLGAEYLLRYRRMHTRSSTLNANIKH